MTNDNVNNADGPKEVWDAEFQEHFQSLRRAIPVVRDFLWSNGDDRDLAAQYGLTMVDSLLGPEYDEHEAWDRFFGFLVDVTSPDNEYPPEEFKGIAVAVCKAIEAGGEVSQPVPITVTTTEFKLPFGNQEDSQRAAELIRAARTNEKPAASQ